MAHSAVRLLESIDECIAFIESAPLSTQQPPPPNTANQRISALLSVYDEWLRLSTDKNKESIADVLSRFYGADGIDGFLRDFAHIVAHLDEDRIYIAKHGHCDVSECAYLRRAHRDTAALSRAQTKNGRVCILECATKRTLR